MSEPSREPILLVLHAYPEGGGISSILENYVAELGDAYDVHVAVVEDRPGRDERLRLPEGRMHVMGYTNAINPLLFPTSLAYSARVAHWLRGIVRAVRPRVIVTQDTLNLGAPAAAAARNTDTRVVVMDHGTLTNVADERWVPMVAKRIGGAKGRLFKAGFRLDTPWRAARWRLAARHADELWFTGEELRPWFERAGERARSYTQTVPTDFVPPSAQERAAARRELGLAEDATVMNMVGRLDGEKGLDTLVDAIEAVGAQPGWSVVIVGDGTLEDWMREALAQRGLQDTVSMLGRLGRADVRRVHQASDFHLYAGTISCGVSICLLEAMASGVVPIVSDVPVAQRDLVGDGGWVFPAGDAGALARALREALKTGPEERRRLSAETVRRVHEAREPTVPELLEALLAR